jgi:ankyrin repeat protein
MFQEIMNFIVKMLLDKQADVDLQTRGSTPLEIACHQGHEEISELLRQEWGNAIGGDRNLRE